MKQGLIAVVVTLAIPVMAFGLQVHMSLTGPGGVSSMTINEGEDFSTTLTISMMSDGRIDGVQYSILANGGDDNALFHAYTDIYDDGYLGTLFGDSGRPDPNRFVVTDINSPIDRAWPMGISLAGLVPDVIASRAPDRAVGLTDLGVFPGTLLSYDISASELAEGDYVISLGNSGWGFIAGNTSEDTVPTVSSFTLHVVPEPASALLLLAAVPFLRRPSA